ncbi:MAG TPA: sulfatase-like hydrolase/transferase [Planctomycetota bacterium]|nr:sulfatase-like hydrolase/transferase [Planctomycetota bacterium]
MRFLPLLLLLSCAPASTISDRRPNIVVILCDDLGYGDVGAYGHPAIRTPNLDRLAAEGWRFTAGYSAAPVCSPSRVGLLTGRTPSRYGVYDWISSGSPVHMNRAAVTLPKLLKRAGYDTALAGKWHCNGKFNSPEQPQPDDHGFDHWFATQNNAGPSHHNPRNFVRNGTPVGPLEGYSCQLVVDEALRWIRGRDDRPYFLYVAFHEPHEAVASPPELVAEYAGTARNADEAQYFANVANMDRAVGRLLEAVGDDAFVYFSSDNGPETLNRYKGGHRSYGTPGPLRGMKLWLYDGGIRVPTIVRWPGRRAPGRVVDTPVASLDLLPTACAIAGVKPPEGLDGSSLLPLLDGRPLARSTPLYWHYYRAFEKPKAAMREGDWMILGHWDGPALAPGGSVKPGDSALIKKHALVGFELYNLREDPGQQRDLAATQPQVLERLSKALVAKYRDVQSEGPLWD